MTTPGGVPNLPQGALTIDTLQSKTQDMSPSAMKSRASERISSIFGGSTGSDPMSAITPFGFLTGLFAAFQSTVANADPNDINGPEDLPGLLLDFIESLPVVGEFVRLLDAIKGTYEGDDETLLAVQAFFVSLRADLEQAQTDADAAADKWAQTTDQLLGTGHGVEDFINMLQGLRDGQISFLAPPNANRLTNPSFDGALSISSTDFEWDPTVYRSPPTPGLVPGSAKAIADGTEKELRSNRLGVAPGQIWTFVANLAAVGLTGSGTLAQLTAQPYDLQGNELPAVVLTGTGTLTGTATIWSAPPPGTMRTAQLVADWTIPETVYFVELRPVLTENATAGSLWLDDMNLSAKSLIPQYWVKDLVDNLTTAFTRFTQLGQIVSGQIVTAFDDFVQDFKDYWTSNFGPAALKAKADQNAAWNARKWQNDQVLGDWFAPLGSVTDTAATLVGGKRTKWGAWNDNWKIIAEQAGLVPTTPPPLVDVGTFAQATETRVIVNEGTLAQVQADVDALKTADTSVAGRKFLVSASGGSAASWGTPWTTTPTNSNIAPDSQNDLYAVSTAASSAVDLTVQGVFNAGTTLTWDQIVSVVFQEAATNMAGGLGPRNKIKGRMSADGLNYVWAEVNYNRVQVGCCVNGVETVWDTKNSVSVPAGALFELRCGSSATHRAYQVLVGGKVVITYAESGTVSMLGDAYTGGGQDMTASHGLANDVFKPARVKQFKLQDSNAAASTYGTSARWYRSSTSGVLAPKAAVVSMGGNVYDANPEYASADIKMFATGFAFYTPGRYRMTHATKVSAATSSPWAWSAIAAGTAYASVNQITNVGGSPTVVSKASSKYDAAAVLGLGGSFSFNAKGDGTASELWAPSIAVAGSGNYSVLGDGGGEGTWVIIERID
ncbi:hypothetical protein [Mycobacterium sp.]|uniref:DUF7257 domain-containing protein n=1 Tax=Mycobacterium sp. TaxID=1785 RepID=UPI0025DDA53C|nr:hypothetical protein [Mycobacterium sp.]